MNRDRFLNQQFREYRLQECIGAGGMGAVFKGVHVRLNALRAIKVLQTELLHEAHFKARFETEAQILAQLDHPNLVRVYEFFEEADHLFLVMEHISGESLFERMRFWGQISIPRAVDVIKQACDGLAHAHARGIVHRDLSPDNLLITLGANGEDILKVIDFGIAKNVFEKYSARTGADDNVTIPGAFIGKVRYCSPEQAAGTTIDHRSDQYSLALILYEAITNTMPFVGDSPIATLAMKMHQDVPRLRDVLMDVHVSESFESVLMRALSRDLTLRYTDILSFKNALIDSLLEQQKEPTEDEQDKTELSAKNELDSLTVSKRNLRETSGEADLEILRTSDLSNLADEIPKDLSTRPSPVKPITRKITRQIETENSLRRIRQKRFRKKAVLIVFSITMWCVGGGLWLRFSSDPWSLKVNNLLENSVGIQIRHSLDSTVSKSPDTQAKSTVKTKDSKQDTKTGTMPDLKDISKVSSGEGPFLSNSKGVSKPTILESSKPSIPRTLETVNLPLTVPVQVVVLKDGRVGRVDLIKSVHPDFDREALRIVQTWRFIPGTRFGSPADIITDVNVVFSR